jgi:hypothetical protein
MPVDPYSIVAGLAINAPVPPFFIDEECATNKKADNSWLRSCQSFDRTGIAIDVPWYWTRPNSAWDVFDEKHSKQFAGVSSACKRVLELDPNLLCRAVRRARELHGRDPVHFPWNHPTIGSVNQASDIASSPLSTRASKFILSRQRRLRTGQSLVLPTPTSRPATFQTIGTILDRTRTILEKRPADPAKGDDDYNFYDVNKIDDSWGLSQRSQSTTVAIASNTATNQSSQENVWSGSRLPLNPDRYDLMDEPQHPVTDLPTPLDDENQIDLDDCLGDDDKDANAPQTAATDDSAETVSVDLLCLGTGCAAPSPHRGASGYAILINPTTALAIDAGEGFVTQWNRHAQRIQCLSTIRIVWISHAQ